MSVTFKGVKRKLELVVVRTDATALLSRIWMAAFPDLQTWLRNAPGVNSIAAQDSIKSVFVTNLCDEISDFFAPGLGKLAGYKAHIQVKPDAHFHFFKPRPFAFAMRSKIEADLDRLQKLGVIEPVQTAKCGSTPVVPVLKANGEVRICGDFKVTVNL